MQKGTGNKPVRIPQVGAGFILDSTGRDFERLGVMDEPDFLLSYGIMLLMK
jgi:hypothetical protein